MAYRLKTAPSVGEELVRVFDEQLSRALHAVNHRGTALAERIHDARTSCKRIRAALRLIQSIEPRIWHRENAWFRDSARDLAALRDAAVMPVTFAVLLKHVDDSTDPNDFVSLRRQVLAHRREALGDAHRIAGVLSRFADRMRRAGDRTTKLKFRTATTAAITAGFGEAYRSARKAWRHAEADRSTSAFHDYRKMAKNHGYHCRLLRCAWPAVMREWQAELSALGDLLGEEHDLAVLDDWLAKNVAYQRADKGAVRLRKLIRSRRTELQKLSLLLGARLFADTRHAVTRRISTWWQTATELARIDREPATDS